MIAPMYVEPGHQLYAAEAVKAAVGGLPVFTVGRITTPDLAEKAIAEGWADVVTMARALIADPELPNKAREGRVEDIRPCLGDNQECIARVNRGLHMGCTVKPAAGREGAWGIGRIAGAIGHAINFHTWQSLVREQQLSVDEAITLMVATVQAAAQPALGPPRQTGN